MFRGLGTFILTAMQIVFSHELTSLNPHQRVGCGKCLYRHFGSRSPCAGCVYYSAFEPACPLVPYYRR